MADEEGTKLFSRGVQVKLKRSDGLERTSILQIHVGLIQSSSPLHRKELYVRLTDESDSFFLHFLCLGEDDFQTLKVQQGLLVDFSAFPQKFIDLIELCIREEANTSPRFLLQFTLCGSTNNSTGVLDVVETNPFKHLIHLSLKFVPGNDEEIKKYLAKCLKVFKEEKANLEEKLRRLETEFATRYSSVEELLSSKTKELDALKNEWSARLSNVTSKHAAELNSEKEKSIQTQSSYEERLQTERREWEDRHRRSVHQLEKRLSEAETSSKDLMDKKYKAESIIRELKSKSSGLDEECRRMNREIQTLRRQNTTLDSDRHERDKTLNHLRTRVAVLEQELKDKEQVITRSSELLETANEQKKLLDDDVKDRHQQVNKLEATVKSLSDEVLKGNEIIHKLQTEIRNLRSQVKLKNIVTTKQERFIEEKDQIIMTLKKELEEVQQNLKVKKEENKGLTESLESTTQKLDESKELLRTNENVINWLNKQLNEQTSVPRYGSHEMTSTASSAQARSSGVRPVMLHSTPTLGRGYSLGTVPAGVLGPSTRHPQVHYRPAMVRKPPTWQSPSGAANSVDGISPVVSSNINAPVDPRIPLRQRQLPSQPVIEEQGPVLDPKYFQRNPSQERLTDRENNPPVVRDRIENLDTHGTVPNGKDAPRHVNSTILPSHRRGAKPFPISAANQQRKEPSTAT